MPEQPVQSDNALQAVFSVCASADVSTAAIAACSEVSGSTFIGEFHDYFSADRRPDISPALKAAAGCVALVDCDRDPELALSTMERLRTMLLKNLSIVAYATTVDAGYLLRAMRAGCNECLTKPASHDDLHGALIRFCKTSAAESKAEVKLGRLISMFGVKGGVGTTTLAVHLANNLVRRHRKRTLLIDHHHELGHVALYLGLKDGQYHFNDLTRNADRLDADLLHGFVIKHTSGLEVLVSPDGCAVDYKSSPEDLLLVLKFLRTQYEYVIIDSSIGYKQIVPTMQQMSDEVYLISTPDVAALRDLTRRVEDMSSADPIGDKLRIVINRATSDDAVSSEQIALAVRSPVWMAMPNNYTDLVRSINTGEPIQVQHRGAFAQQISKWAEKIMAAAGAPEKGAQGGTNDVGAPGISKKGFTLWRSKREKAG